MEFISELTGKIILFHQSALKYVSIAEWSDGGTKEERRKIFAETLTAFDDYYFPRRLFIPSHTVGKIDAFRKGLLDISFDFMVRVEKGRDDGGNSDKQLDVWVKANEYITKENPKIIMDLENEFRKLLGMDEK